MTTILTSILTLFLIVEANQRNPDDRALLSLAIATAAGLIAMGVERLGPKTAEAGGAPGSGASGAADPES